MKDFYTGLVMVTVIAVLAVACVMYLPNAIDQSLGIGKYYKCTDCHDDCRREEVYFNE